MIDCACDDGPRSGFLPTGERWTYIGTLTFADATGVYGFARPGVPASDCRSGRMHHADSSALAVMLALKRRAAAEAPGWNLPRSRQASTRWRTCAAILDCSLAGTPATAPKRFSDY
jgi:hypothetical protein